MQAREGAAGLDMTELPPLDAAVLPEGGRAAPFSGPPGSWFLFGRLGGGGGGGGGGGCFPGGWGGGRPFPPPPPLCGGPPPPLPRPPAPRTSMPRSPPCHGRASITNGT